MYQPRHSSGISYLSVIDEKVDGDRSSNWSKEGGLLLLTCDVGEI